MPKKQRLTIEEHELAGEILSRIHQEVLIKLSVFFGNRYPKNGKLARKLKQADDCINQARTLAEAEVASEYPNEKNPPSYYKKDFEPNNISELVKRLIDRAD